MNNLSINITEGCNKGCLFCNIKKPLISDKIENILMKLLQVVDIDKISLKGHSPVEWTHDSSTIYDLLYMIHMILKREKNNKCLVSLSNISLDYPDIENIMPFINSDKVHIGLHHTDNQILKNYNVKHTFEDFLKFYIICKNYNKQIYCDVIVGLPGETEKQFSDMVNILSDLDNIILFPFVYNEISSVRPLYINSKDNNFNHAGEIPNDPIILPKDLEIISEDIKNKRYQKIIKKCKVNLDYINIVPSL